MYFSIYLIGRLFVAQYQTIWLDSQILGLFLEMLIMG